MELERPHGCAVTAQTLAERMTLLPVGHLLSGDSLISLPNASAASRLIHCLTPSNMNVAYLAPAGYECVAEEHAREPDWR